MGDILKFLARTRIAARPRVPKALYRIRAAPGMTEDNRASQRYRIRCPIPGPSHTSVQSYGIFPNRDRPHEPRFRPSSVEKRPPWHRDDRARTDKLREIP